MMGPFFQAACSRRIVKNALMIALVVGSVLNVINQGSAIFANAQVSWFHLLLNYLVPYSVASYSAARNEQTQRDEE